MIDEIKEMCKEMSLEAFDKYVNYGFLTGSIIYTRPEDFPTFNSDIDLLLLLDRAARDDEDILDRRALFNQRYLEMHNKFGFTPDYVFPGEIIDTSMLEDVINGAGFQNNNGILTHEMLPDTDESWLTSADMEYRCWRSMYFYTRDDALFVNQKGCFKENREDVLSLFISYLSNNKDVDTVDELEELIVQRIKSSSRNEFGHLPSYESFLFDDQNKLKNISLFDVLNAFNKVNQDGTLKKGILRNEYLIPTANSLNYINQGVEHNPYLLSLEVVKK